MIQGAARTIIFLSAPSRAGIRLLTRYRGLKVHLGNQTRFAPEKITIPAADAEWLFESAVSGVGVLSSGVMMGSPAGALVMRTDTPERLVALPLGTLPCAVNIAAIAATTDADRDPAAPCIAGITGVRSCAPTGSAPPKVRESGRGFPGGRCFGVSPQLSENGSRGVTAKSTSGKLRQNVCRPRQTIEPERAGQDGVVGRCGQRYHRCLAPSQQHPRFRRD